MELQGLISQPNLNGGTGIIIASKLNPKTGRWAVRLEDGSCIAVKPSNLIAVTPNRKLEVALKNLEKAGGTEEEAGDDDGEELASGRRTF